MLTKEYRFHRTAQRTWGSIFHLALARMHKKSSVTLFIPAAYASRSTKLEKFLSKKRTNTAMFEHTQGQFGFVHTQLP
jgi:hypothetical protein